MGQTVVAYAFLLRDKMPLLPIWRKYFEGAYCS